MPSPRDAHTCSARILFLVRRCSRVARFGRSRGYGRRMSPTQLLPFTRDGSGETLLLLHGLGTTRQDFDRILPLLAERFDVLAVDLPGQGQARALDVRPTVPALVDALEADLDARGLERVHVLGNLLGARLALELARRGRARSVVAIAPSGLSIPPERIGQVSGMALTGLAMRVLRPLLPSISKRRAGRAALLVGLRGDRGKRPATRPSPSPTGLVLQTFGVCSGGRSRPMLRPTSTTLIARCS